MKSDIYLIKAINTKKYSMIGKANCIASMGSAKLFGPIANNESGSVYA